MNFSTFFLTLIFSFSAFPQWKRDNNSLIKIKSEILYLAPKVQGIDFKFDQYGQGTPEAATFLFTKDCAQQNFQQFGAAFDNNLNNLSSPIERMQCSAIETLKKTKRLNESVCKSLAACLKLKITNNPLINAKIILDATENTAAEAIALMSKNRIDDMMKFEELRLFAEKKYGKDFMPKNCRELKTFKFKKETEDSKCNTKIIDIGFNLGMSNCNFAQVGCNPDFSAYMKNLNTPNDQSHLASFFEKKSENNVTVIFAQEEVVSEKLALILMDTKQTPEEKVEEMFMFFIENNSKINPVYKDYLISFTNDPKRKETLKKGIASYIKANRSKNKVEMISSFEDLKKSETKSMLEDKCNKIEVNDMTTMNGLCRLVDDIVAGGEVEVDDREFNKFYTNRLLENDKSLDVIRDLAKNVSRCNTFTLVTSKESVIMNLKNKLSGDSDLLSDVGVFYNSKSTKDDQLVQFAKRDTLVISASGVPEKRNDNFLIGVRPYTKAETQRETILESRFTQNMPLTDTSKLSKSSGALTAPAVKDETIKEAVAKEVLVQNSALQSTQVAKEKVGSLANTYTQAQKPNAYNSKNDYDYNEQANPIHVENPKNIAEKKENNNEYSALINKVQTLESRLAQAKSGDKKIIASESSALTEDNRLGKEIKSFKEELEEIKKLNEMEKNQVAKNITDKVKKLDNINQRTDSVISNQDPKKPYSAVSESTAAISSAPVSVASQTSISEKQTPAGSSASASANAEQIKSELTGKYDLQILTSSSVAGSNESIAELISANAGQPFFIEEDGMVQQIIPELINGQVILDNEGKPVYKKIPRGKSGDFNIKLNPKTKRSIANLVSPADVKRLDESSAKDHIRYQQMKESLKIP